MKTFPYSFESAIYTNLGLQNYRVSGGLTFVERGEYRAELSSVEILDQSATWVHILDSMRESFKEDLIDMLVEKYLAELEVKKRRRY